MVCQAEIDRSLVSLLENDKKSQTRDTLFRVTDAIVISAYERIDRVEKSSRRKAADKGSERPRQSSPKETEKFRFYFLPTFAGNTDAGTWK